MKNSDWTSGYVSNIGYTHGYYGELNPIHARTALLTKGYEFPRIRTACELGFGQGISTLIHSAASDIEWYGTDFNPEQALYASELASVTNCTAKLYDDSFSEFISRNDLPQFDFIALHGVWSWISDDNRQTIVEFLRRKLRLGGIVYLSYNSLPGWSTFAPIRHLMTQHAECFGTAGTGIEKKIEDALSFSQSVLDIDTAFKRDNPTAPDKLDSTKKHNAQYLAHEYFNRDWHPVYFSDIASDLTPAKLSFASSANLLDAIDFFSFTEPQRKILSQVTDPLFRETLRDFMTNQMFRRDYWARGLNRLSTPESNRNFRETRVVFGNNREDIELKINSNIGELSLKKEIYNPILDELENKPLTTIGDLEARVAKHGVSFENLIQASLVLLSKFALRPAQDDQQISRAEQQTSRLNAELLSRAELGKHVKFLASPIIGGGVVVDRLEQLLLLSRRKNHTSGRQRAEYVLEVFESLGERLLGTDGAVIESRDDRIKRIEELDKKFEDKRLPILQRMAVT